jgi:hypothetical protein
MTKAEALDLARRHLEREFRVLFEAEKAEYLADTGQAMPTTIDEMKVAARLAGFTAGEAEAGDYTLAAIHRQAVATKQIDERHRQQLAAEIVARVKTEDPAALVDRYQRAAAAMNANARKVVASLARNNATKQGDSFTRADIEEDTGLSPPQVKAAIEVELRRVSEILGAAIIDSKASHGSWLSPEGIELAKRIDQRILNR